MKNLRLWYSRNRKNIWKTSGIVLAVILIIQLVNYYYKKKNEEQLSNINITNNQTQNINSNFNTITLEEKTSLTNDKVTEEQKTGAQLINDFIEKCNNKNIQEAYDMLSKDCKDELYPNETIFEQAYYNNIFNDSKKQATVENWIDNIYKVLINDDYLSTGKYSDENNIQDYITIVQEDDKDKLNINNYIGKEAIAKSAEDDNLTMEVQEINTYKDYQIYKIKVTNKSSYNIALDDGVNVSAMYLEDQNGIKYSAYTHELGKSQLLLEPRQTKEIKIKYYNKYSSNRKIKQMVFSRIVLDNAAYQIYEDKSLYKDYDKINIDL